MTAFLAVARLVFVGALVSAVYFVINDPGGLFCVGFFGLLASIMLSYFYSDSGAMINRQHVEIDRESLRVTIDGPLGGHKHFLLLSNQIRDMEVLKNGDIKVTAVSDRIRLNLSSEEEACWIRDSLLAGLTEGASLHQVTARLCEQAEAQLLEDKDPFDFLAEGRG